MPDQLIKGSLSGNKDEIFNVMNSIKKGSGDVAPAKTETKKTPEEVKAEVAAESKDLDQKMKGLQAQGRVLRDQDKMDTPEYDSLIDQHVKLRNRQRFLEGQPQVNPDDFKFQSAKPKGTASLNEPGGNALDRLLSESQSEES